MIINLNFDASSDNDKRTLLLTVEEILETEQGKRDLFETCEDYVKNHPSIARDSAAEGTIDQVLIGVRGGIPDPGFLDRWRDLRDGLMTALAKNIAERAEP